MNVNVSLACWPALAHRMAARHLAAPPQEPLFGRLSTEHVQIVPQCRGVVDEALIDGLRAAWPATRFRLHANVRVLPEHRFANLSGFDVHADWFRQAARISRRCDASVYTAHAGARAEANMAGMLDNARRCADLFGCAVGVEGHYPTALGQWLLTTWDEYRMLFDSGLPYVLDLSHLNILAYWSGRREEALIAEMLACERCLEVHVSDNDGQGDWHRVCEEPPWWLPLLEKAHAAAVVFSEGNHRYRERVASVPPAA
jgi:hypothetical protein